MKSQLIAHFEPRSLGAVTASIHLTFFKNDFIEYEELQQPILVETAANDVFIRGKGSVLLHHKVSILGVIWQCTMHLYPVYLILKLTARLLSLGEFLHQGMSIHGDAKQLSLSLKKVRFLVLQCISRAYGDNIFWLYTQVAEYTNIATVYAMDYDLMHRRFGHPSKDVLKHAQSVMAPRGCVADKHSSLVSSDLGNRGKVLQVLGTSQEIGRAHV